MDLDMKSERKSTKVENDTHNQYTIADLLRDNQSRKHGYEVKNKVENLENGTCNQNESGSSIESSIDSNIEKRHTISKRVSRNAQKKNTIRD